MSHPLNRPLVVWGTSSNFNDGTYWVTTSLTKTAGQDDPFGGTDAWLLEDADGALERIAAHTFVAPQVEYCVVNAFLKAGTAAISGLRILNSTLVQTAHQLQVTWTGGVPSLATTVLNAPSGSFQPPILVSPGWYLIRFMTELRAGHTYRYDIAPAAPATATGTVYIYLPTGGTVLLPDLDEIVAYSLERDGAEVVQYPSGHEDASSLGRDYYLDGLLRRIPVSYDMETSGWDGSGLAHSVAIGLDTWLTAGQRKVPCRFVPDRTDATRYYDDCYLVRPGLTDVPTLEPDGTRQLGLSLRNPTLPFLGYSP